MLRGRDDVRDSHPQKQEHNQAEIHSRHKQPSTGRHLKVTALFIAFLVEQGPQPGQRDEENEADEEVWMDHQQRYHHGCPNQRQPGRECRDDMLVLGSSDSVRRKLFEPDVVIVQQPELIFAVDSASFSWFLSNFCSLKFAQEPSG
jgi:hypothetical protein